MGSASVITEYRPEGAVRRRSEEGGGRGGGDEAAEWEREKEWSEE